MCGIALSVSKSSEYDNEKVVKNMLNLMFHRGDDSIQIFNGNMNDFKFSLGHRSLAINDINSSSMVTM